MEAHLEEDRIIITPVTPGNVIKEAFAGASKRLTELLMKGYDRNHRDGYFSKSWQKIYGDQVVDHSTRFMAVRFGNVVGSSGSVIPLFKRQIDYLVIPMGMAVHTNELLKIYCKSSRFCSSCQKI